MTVNEARAALSELRRVACRYSLQPNKTHAAILVDRAGHFAYQVIEEGGGDDLVRTSINVEKFNWNQGSHKWLEFLALTHPSGIKTAVRIVSPVLGKMVVIEDQLQPASLMFSDAAELRYPQLGFYVMFLCALGLHPELGNYQGDLMDEITTGLVEMADNSSRDWLDKFVAMFLRAAKDLFWTWRRAREESGQSSRNTEHAATTTSDESQIGLVDGDIPGSGAQHAPTTKRKALPRGFYLSEADVPDRFYKGAWLTGKKRHLAKAFEMKGNVDDVLESKAKAGLVAVVHRGGQWWDVYFRTETQYEIGRTNYQKAEEERRKGTQQGT